LWRSQSPSPYAAAYKHYPDVTGVEWRLVEHDQDKTRLALRAGAPMIPNAHTYRLVDLSLSLRIISSHP